MARYYAYGKHKAVSKFCNTIRYGATLMVHSEVDRNHFARRQRKLKMQKLEEKNEKELKRKTIEQIRKGPSCNRSKTLFCYSVKIVFQKS